MPEEQKPTTKKKRGYGQGLKRATFKLRPDQISWVRAQPGQAELVRALFDSAMKGAPCEKS